MATAQSAGPATKIVSEAELARLRSMGFQPGNRANPAGSRHLKDRAKALFDRLAPDFGELSKVDEVLLQRACEMLIKAERLSARKDADAIVRLNSEARRTLAQLGKRAPRKAAPSLADILREDREATLRGEVADDGEA